MLFPFPHSHFITACKKYKFNLQKNIIFFTVSSRRKRFNKRDKLFDKLDKRFEDICLYALCRIAVAGVRGENVGRVVRAHKELRIFFHVADRGIAVKGYLFYEFLQYIFMFSKISACDYPEIFYNLIEVFYC